MIQLLFWTGHNDLTNAFKGYEIRCSSNNSSFIAAHFNITIEMSLSTLIRQYKYISVPNSLVWKKMGQSNLKLRAMGRRYLATPIKIWFERILI